MTFIALPPEVNVGRLMTGPGPVPMSNAAAMWASVAAAIRGRNLFITTLLPRLTSAWNAPETALMTRQVAQYVAYNEGLHAQAVLASSRHAKQAADYTAALASMVQVPEITANHVTNATLHATNFLGVNTGAIAANEAQYAAMWAHNAGVMTAYLASSTANMTFEPFLVPKPMASPNLAPPPMAVAALASVGDAVATKITLAAQAAEAAASTARMQIQGSAILAATPLRKALLAPGVANRVSMEHDLKETEAPNSRPNQNQQQSGQQLSQQLMQQLVTQAPQQGVQAAQSAAQVPQQLAQQATQVPQQAFQAVQPFSQLVSSIGQGNQTPTVGYFGTSPSSPTLDAAATGGAGGGGAFALRGAMPFAFAAPSSWSTGGAAGAVPAAAPPPVPRAPMEPVRPMGTPGSNAPLTRSQGKQRERVVVPLTAAMPIPVYQQEPPKLEADVVGAVDAGREGGD